MPAGMYWSQCPGRVCRLRPCELRAAACLIAESKLFHQRLYDVLSESVGADRFAVRSTRTDATNSSVLQRSKVQPLELKVLACKGKYDESFPLSDQVSSLRVRSDVQLVTGGARAHTHALIEQNSCSVLVSDLGVGFLQQVTNENHKNLCTPT